MDVGFAQIRDAAIDRATAYGGRAVAKVGAKTVHRERAAREFYPYRIEKMETAGQSCRLSAASWAFNRQQSCAAARTCGGALTGRLWRGIGHRHRSDVAPCIGAAVRDAHAVLLAELWAECDRRTGGARDGLRVEDTEVPLIAKLVAGRAVCSHAQRHAVAAGDRLRLRLLRDDWCIADCDR